MPKAVERALKRKGKSQGLTGKDLNRFVYGTLRHEYGWKPKSELAHPSKGK